MSRGSLLRGLVIALASGGACEDRRRQARWIPASWRGAVARAMRSGLPGKYGFNLALQRCRVERLDDVIVDAGLLRGDDVFGLGFRRDHDEGRVREFRAGP